MRLFAPDAHVDCAPTVIAMLERQARAWTIGDFSEASADWHPQGVLTAPGNRIPFDRLGQTIAAFHRDYGDLAVTVTNVFASADGRRLALEWLWEVTRRRDGARSLTEDAILVDLDEDGLILFWREYFDTASAVEDHHADKHEPAGSTDTL